MRQLLLVEFDDVPFGFTNRIVEIVNDVLSRIKKQMVLHDAWHTGIDGPDFGNAALDRRQDLPGVQPQDDIALPNLGPQCGPFLRIALVDYSPPAVRQPAPASPPAYASDYASK